MISIYTEILAPLEVFKNSLYYHILKDFLIAPVNLKYIYAISLYIKLKSHLSVCLSVCIPFEFTHSSRQLLHVSK